MGWQDDAAYFVVATAPQQGEYAGHLWLLQDRGQPQGARLIGEVLLRGRSRIGPVCHFEYACMLAPLACPVRGLECLHLSTVARTDPCVDQAVVYARSRECCMVHDLGQVGIAMGTCWARAGAGCLWPAWASAWCCSRRRPLASVWTSWAGRRCASLFWRCRRCRAAASSRRLASGSRWRCGRSARTSISARACTPPTPARATRCHARWCRPPRRGMTAPRPLLQGWGPVSLPRHIPSVPCHYQAAALKVSCHSLSASVLGMHALPPPQLFTVMHAQTFESCCAWLYHQGALGLDVDGGFYALSGPTDDGAMHEQNMALAAHYACSAPGVRLCSGEGFFYHLGYLHLTSSWAHVRTRPLHTGASNTCGACLVDRRSRREPCSPYVIGSYISQGTNGSAARCGRLRGAGGMRFADAPDGPGLGAWLACTADGAVTELSLIRHEEYPVLAAVEAVLGRDRVMRPPTGREHAGLRAAVRASCGGSPALAARLTGV